MTIIGWGDESTSNATHDPGTYLVAVVLADESVQEDVRESMRALRFPGWAKLHWRDETASRRTVIAATLAELPASGLVVVRSTPTAPGAPGAGQAQVS